MLEMTRINESFTRARLLVFCYENHKFALDANSLSVIDAISIDQYTKMESCVKIESHLGQPIHGDQGYSHLLSFRSKDDGLFKILVNGPLDMVEVPADCVFALPQFVSARILYKNIKAMSVYQNKFIYIVNV